MSIHAIAMSLLPTDAVSALECGGVSNLQSQYMQAHSRQKIDETALSLAMDAPLVLAHNCSQLRMISASHTQ